MEVMMLFRIKRKVPKLETKANSIRITLPSEIRQILGISNDGTDYIYYEVDDNHKVTLTKAED
jgi:bifunctional DNA-binding transcriptional regulator/antitoxin component of YhaV-PrlF toxin-antitoxin module